MVPKTTFQFSIGDTTYRCPNYPLASDMKITRCFVQSCISEVEKVIPQAKTHKRRTFESLKNEMKAHGETLQNEAFYFASLTCPLPEKAKAEKLSQAQVQSAIAAVDAKIGEAPEIKKLEWLFVKAMLEKEMANFRVEGYGEWAWRRITWG